MDSSVDFTPSKPYVTQDLSAVLTDSRPQRLARGKGSTLENDRILSSLSNVAMSPPQRRRTTSLMKKQPSHTGLRQIARSQTVNDSLEELADNLGQDEATARPTTRVLTAQSSVRAKQSTPPTSVMLGNATTKTTEKDEEILALKNRLATLEIERRQNNRSSKIIGEKDVDAELVRQFAAQERLLAGYQRENEKALNELQILRTREKQIAAHLTRLYGPQWEESIFGVVPPTGSPSVSKQKSPPSTHTSSLQPSESSTAVNVSPVQPQKSIPFDAAALLAHIASVQLLVENMEARLTENQQNLDAKEKQARAETDRFQNILANAQ